MSSPHGSATTVTSSSGRPPVHRNKSSTNLSNHGGNHGGSGGGTSFRAKRNKSSSSLHGGAVGHHNVQFTHHNTKKAAAHRRSSTGKKAHVDFGFTSMKSPDQDDHALHDDDHEDRHHYNEQGQEGGRKQKRPQLDHRTTSSSSTGSATAQQQQERGRRVAAASSLNDRSAPASQEEERGRSKSRSKSRGSRERSRNRHIQPITTATTNTTSTKPPPPSQVLSTVVSSVQDSSEWGSAQDSPLNLGKELPSVAPQASQGTSGLGQVMGAGDARAQEGEAPPRPPSSDQASLAPPATVKPRASFEIDNRVNEDSPTTPSPPPPPPPAPPVADAENRLPRNALAPGSPTTAKGKSRAAESPKTTPPNLTVSIQSGTPSPPPTASTSTAPLTDKNYQQSPVAFPSQSPTASPSRRHPSHQANGSRIGGRKSSNASLMSMNSTRSIGSFVNLLGAQHHPGGGGLRRSMSGIIAPTIDKGAVARGEMFNADHASLSAGDLGKAAGAGAAIGGGGGAHKRHDSTTSMRSLQTVAESGSSGGGRQSPRRAATMGADPVRPGGERRRATSSQSTTGAGSSALAALGKLGVPAHGATRPPLSPSQKRHSGYFSTLRGLTSLPGMTPSVAPVPVAKGPPAASAKGKSRASPSPQFTPLISKFVDLPAVETTWPVSASPSAMRAGFGGRTTSSASLSGLGSGLGGSSGTMNRTQQKAMLARDMPYFSNGAAGPTTSEAASQLLSQGFYAGPTQTQSGAAGGSSGTQGQRMARAHSGVGREGMQKWAIGLVKEAERIERQYRCVEKWRDPLGESLERVLGRDSHSPKVGNGSAAPSGTVTPAASSGRVATRVAA